jgi:hypothetical protein
MLIHPFVICEHEIVLHECKSKQKQFQDNQTNFRIALEKLKKIWIFLVFI